MKMVKVKVKALKLNSSPEEIILQELERAIEDRRRKLNVRAYKTKKSKG